MKQTRRSFIQSSLTASGSLYIAFAIPGGARTLASESDGPNAGNGFQSLYLKVTPDNQFHLTFDRAEMGQGVITGQATLFGEEADIDPLAFIMEPAPADADSRYGMQITGGSTSTRDRGQELRRAGASYRQTLIAVASHTWGVPASEISTTNGRIMHAATSRNEPYAFFNTKMASVELIDKPILKSPEDFIYIGKFNGTVDADDKVRGLPHFGIDVDLPDMRTAIVIRSPIFGGTLRGFNRDKIKALTYVEDVFEIPSGVAIVCGKYWQALKVRAALTSEMIEWNIPDNLRMDSESLFKNYHATLEKEAPKSEDPDDVVVSAEYELPFLTHAPLEPQNCTAWYQGGRFEIWAPTQAPQMLQSYAADVAGLSRKDVYVHVSKYLGGGFGRRASLDFGTEAIEIAYRVKYPVKVVWSREDDMMHSPLRPMSVHRLDAVVNLKDQKIKSWRHQIAGQSILSPLLKSGGALMAPGWIPKTLRQEFAKLASGAIETFNILPMLAEGAEQAYNFPVETKLKQMHSAIPVTFWRSVGNSHNGFVVEGFLDEVCHAMGEDPYAFRRKLLHKNNRAVTVLDLVAEKAGWDSQIPKGNRALGIAYHYSYKSYAAEIADVEVLDNKIIVHKFFAAVDCGQIVNPEIVRRQMRSGILFGLTAALHGEITFKDGVMQQQNYDTYPVSQLHETPEIDVYLIDSREGSTGIGEPGYPPALPAIANAVFRITGKRLRRTPFNLG